MSRIYLDHNATTPAHPTALAAMVEASTHFFGNPSSLHAEGRAARQVLEKARGEVALLIGASPAEVLFTSGGTESNSTAILGAARASARARGRPGQLVSSPLEHPSVRSALEQLQAEGFKLTWLPVDGRGGMDPAELRRLVSQEETALVSLALVNHELGNLYPIAELCQLSHQYGALFHCDAVQAVGRVPLSVMELDVDLLSISSHKLFGPKGVGALFVRSRAASPTKAQRTPSLTTLSDMPPLLRGGAQEKGRRAGTENVPGIAGFGAAAALCRREMLSRWAQVAALRDALEARLLRIPGARVHGDTKASARAPGTLNIAFSGVEGELLFMNLDLAGIAVSTGAACSSGSPEPSAVLLAMGLERRQALEAIRISLGPENSAAELEQAAQAIEASVALVRASGGPPAGQAR